MVDHLLERHDLGSIMRADIAEAVSIHTRGMVAMTPDTIACAQHVLRQHADYHEGLAAANRLYGSDVDCKWDACNLARAILAEACVEGAS